MTIDWKTFERLSTKEQYFCLYDQFCATLEIEDLFTSQEVLTNRFHQWLLLTYPHLSKLLDNPPIVYYTLMP